MQIGFWSVPLAILFMGFMAGIAFAAFVVLAVAILDAVKITLK